ncbi:DUF2164 domain-containing protein [Crenobacter sp. SG2305]|uniref:DUF2164 domain-containing protein n=1 Tax=Crenobacter oryzisoli TaxID=3056844 RepID=UPI0025AAC189|nr:DUF2164 domain-containing protein [Crenobacter sp. SG2305]MDN0081265.1 DUF2164 domain-containing protein [Crenobacter sp. SG2305]
MATPIWLSPVQLAELAPALQRRLAAEHDCELGGLEVQQLLCFVAEQIGPALYNRAVQDAQKVVAERFERLQDDLWQLEVTS